MKGQLRRRIFDKWIYIIYSCFLRRFSSQLFHCMHQFHSQNQLNCGCWGSPRIAITQSLVATMESFSHPRCCRILQQAVCNQYLASSQQQAVFGCHHFSTNPHYKLPLYKNQHYFFLFVAKKLPSEKSGRFIQKLKSIMEGLAHMQAFKLHNSKLHQIDHYD